MLQIAGTPEETGPEKSIRQHLGSIIITVDHILGIFALDIRPIFFVLLRASRLTKTAFQPIVSSVHPAISRGKSRLGLKPGIEKGRVFQEEGARPAASVIQKPVKEPDHSRLREALHDHSHPILIKETTLDKVAQTLIFIIWIRHGLPESPLSSF
jgi:hypothetical protein